VRWGAIHAPEDSPEGTVLIPAESLAFWQIRGAKLNTSSLFQHEKEAFLCPEGKKASKFRREKS
jgi:hypothetical protein